MFQVIFIFSGWILTEQIIASSTLLSWRKNFQKILPGFLSGRDWAWVKKHWFNDFLEMRHHKLKNFCHTCWNITLLTYFLVLTCEFRYFWKWGAIRIRVPRNRRLRLLGTLWIGVSRKFNLHFTLMFQLRYCKMVQSLVMQKLVSKITGIWTTSDK